MRDMNAVIVHNINTCLEKKQKKQVDLAEYLCVSKQTVSKMLNGTRTIHAAELQKISKFCDTTMEALTSIPENYEEMNVFHVFMGQVKTKEAQQAIEDIDTAIELLLFHDMVKENSVAMREEWTEL